MPFQKKVMTERGRPDLSPGVEAVVEQLTREMGLAQLVGDDPAFLQVLDLVPRVARREGTVLITGETGTGKELCARAIHCLSRRCNLPFIPVDCGALPDSLIENELFGHARGAYTGAHSRQKGLLALAEGGTLFLDEIDSLSLPAQAKLLRVLQDRSYRPLGAEQFERADVKVIAATNRDLETCVRDKAFRADLFYRLNVFRLQMVALRERPGDIPLLARHFLERLARECGTGPRSFSADALQHLCRYAWPGNVRELLNVVERALAFADGPVILPGHLALPLPDLQTDGRAPAGGLSFRQARAQAIAQFERTYITALLERHDGNISRAAREAQKERRAFGRLVKKYRPYI